MAVRSTMSKLIESLRGMTNAGVNDYSIGTMDFWSDLQLQTVLDQYAIPVIDELLSPVATIVSTGYATYDYQSHMRWFEMTDEGTSRFIIKDTAGNVISSSLWSVNYDTGRITFGSDTESALYYLSGYSYDVYAAAGNVWRQKAAHALEMIDFSTAGHSVKRSHIAENAIKMAELYEGKALAPSGGIVSIERSDLNAI